MHACVYMCLYVFKGWKEMGKEKTCFFYVDFYNALLIIRLMKNVFM